MTPILPTDEENAHQITLFAEGCDDLPALRTPDGFKSRWTLSDEERLAVLLGSDITVELFGTLHPPIRLEITEQK